VQAHLRTFMRAQQLQREVAALEQQLAELRGRPAVQQALGQPAVAKKLEALGLRAECSVYEAETKR
jgi:ribosomal protein L29